MTVGGSGVGGHLLRRVIAAFPEAKERVPELRMTVVAGPRTDPGSLSAHDGLEVLPYIHELLSRSVDLCDRSLGAHAAEQSGWPDGQAQLDVIEAVLAAHRVELIGEDSSKRNPPGGWPSRTAEA